MFEKVNPCHPDKVADRIAGALVDAAYRKEENPRIAVEVLIGHGVCHIIAETSAHISLDEVKSIVHRIAGQVPVIRLTFSDPVIQGREFAAEENRAGINAKE